jgi:hypothetical protein
MKNIKEIFFYKLSLNECAMIVLFFLLMSLFGCQTNPMIEPSECFVNTVGTEYLIYVEADKRLPEGGKRARRMNVEAFRRLIEEAKK